MSIEGKQIDIGRSYEGKLSFPSTYEKKITGAGSEDNVVLFDDVFPTIFYSFSVKKTFMFYLDGYYYGPFDLKGSEKAMDDLNQCKLNLTKAVSPADSEKLFSYFSETDDPLGASITISPCTGEEVGECISHSLSCEKASRNGPELAVIVGDVDKIVSSLVVGTGGNAKAQLKLANGSSVDLRVNSVLVDPNAMNGGWVATVGLGTIDDFFEALNEKSSEGASLIVAEQDFSLAPQKGDGRKLVAWKDACIALEAQSLPE
ncbi:hypothetical protein LRP31_23605 [Mesorhizobium mediterraneum]|nr:hypothetical protein [Mesorhizobium mediterraneum]WIW52033.1 hypothetical protein LRP31_23605 [Mesorhizobium mediterraneum]